MRNMDFTAVGKTPHSLSSTILVLIEVLPPYSELELDENRVVHTPTQHNLTTNGGHYIQEHGLCSRSQGSSLPPITYSGTLRYNNNLLFTTFG
jgi:hypothetical protein